MDARWPRIPPYSLRIATRISRRIRSARGSEFLLCQKAATDPCLRKYPRLPVLTCAGFTRLRAES